MVHSSLVFPYFTQAIIHICIYIISMASCKTAVSPSLQRRHNEHDGVWNHRRLNCLLNRLFRCTSKKTSKLGITGLCEGNSPVTGEFPTQRASNAENVSIWWRHHVLAQLGLILNHQFHDGHYHKLTQRHQRIVIYFFVTCALCLQDLRMTLITLLQVWVLL